jgi:hypothetical protein
VPEVPDVESSLELLVTASSIPFWAKAGVDAARVPTNKKANSLCLNDFIFAPLEMN